MTFADWLAESVERYRTQPAHVATRRSAQEFWRGAVRRSIDPHLGQTWWERDEDWDVLVVLDAMRVDVADEVIDEDVRGVWSPASTSIDWIERHFADGYRDEWRDTAYVTGNPFAANDAESARSADLDEKRLAHFDPVYKRKWQKDAVGTTPPEAMTEAALSAWARDDVDRLIVHYMQPHQPFRSRPEWEHVYSNLENLTTDVNQGGPDIWKRCRDGELGREDVWEAYRDNVEWVWEEVTEYLLPYLDGDVLVTADHGNGMGEWGVWSHPPATIAPQVRKVPVIAPEEVGFADATPGVDGAETGPQNDSSTVEQLEALGYR